MKEHSVQVIVLNVGDDDKIGVEHICRVVRYGDKMVDNALKGMNDRIKKFAMKK
jgi:hypothetical protein